MIQVMIIEDDANIRKILRKMIERHGQFQVVAEAETASAAIEFYEVNPVELLMVDIDLGEENGLECARKICDMNPKAKIVFTTAHSEYMADAFEIYAFDYIVKPYNLERLNRTLDRIVEVTNGHSEMPEATDNVKKDTQKADKLMIKSKEEIYFVDVSEILFVERVQGNTRVITMGMEYQTSMSLSEIEEKLDPKIFMRSHRSYIIQLGKISKMTQYGRWTYSVNFEGTKETALMTYENFEQIKKRYM